MHSQDTANNATKTGEDSRKSGETAGKFTTVSSVGGFAGGETSISNSIASRVAASVGGFAGGETSISNSIAPRVVSSIGGFAGGETSISNSIAPRVAAPVGRFAGGEISISNSIAPRVAASIGGFAGGETSISNSIAPRVAAPVGRFAGGETSISNSIAPRVAASVRGFAGGETSISNLIAAVSTVEFEAVTAEPTIDAITVTERSPIVFKVVFPPNSVGVVPDEQTREKLVTLVKYAAGQINYQLSLKNYLHFNEATTVEVNQNCREQDSPVTFKFIVDIYNRVKAFTSVTEKDVSIHIPTRLIGALAAHDDERQMSTQQRKVFEHLLCHVLHEFFHVCGALHSSEGFMSGPVPLFDGVNEGVDIMNSVDRTSFKIFQAALSGLRASTIPVHVSFCPPENIAFNCAEPIELVVWVNNNSYTTVYEEIGCQNNLRCPHDRKWDAVLLICSFGQIHYFTKQSIYDGCGPQRTINL